MAKENYVLLCGELQSLPVINKKKAVIVLKTLRRNDKEDYPIIDILDDELIKNLNSFKEKDYIVVKGILSTSEVKKGVCCPHCNSIIKKEGTTTEIIAIELINIGPDHSLLEVKEISNTVMLLGSLCRNPEFRILANSGVPSAQYQLAVNRKYNVKKQQDSFTDHPWVNSFGKQAEQDAVRLQTGSQVFINGGLQTRNVQKNIECPNCNKDFKAEDFVAEIVPYSVEYLNNCIFE